MVETYDIGDRITVTGTFTNKAGALADPTTIVFKYRVRGGEAVTGTASKASTGVYTADVDLTEAGQWYFRFTGTGAVVAAGELRCEVRGSYFS